MGEGGAGEDGSVTAKGVEGELVSGLGQNEILVFCFGLFVLNGLGMTNGSRRLLTHCYSALFPLDRRSRRERPSKDLQTRNHSCLFFALRRLASSNPAR